MLNHIIDGITVITLKSTETLLSTFIIKFILTLLDIKRYFAYQKVKIWWILKLKDLLLDFYFNLEQNPHCSVFIHFYIKIIKICIVILADTFKQLLDIILVLFFCSIKEATHDL